MSFFVGMERGLAQRDQNRIMQKKLDLKKDELAFNREMSLVNAFLDQKKGYKTAQPKGYDTQTLIDARNKLLSYSEKVDPEDMDEATKKILTQAQEEPHLAVDIVNFIEDQAKTHSRVIKITELPTLINIMENPKLNNEQKFDIVKELELIDVNNKDQFKELMIKIKTLNGSELGINRNLRQFTLVPDIEAGIKGTELSKKQDKQVQDIGALIVPFAQTFVSNNPNSQDPKVLETQSALDNLRRSGSGPEMTALKNQALGTLYRLHLGSDFMRQYIIGQPQFIDLNQNILFDALSRAHTVRTITVSQDNINEDPRLEGMLGQQIQVYLQADGKFEPILN
tara:strand:+ start:1511 stop:2527 length:1017 start_codon:yes stop_codon:yes gene_type:complete